METDRTTGTKFNLAKKLGLSIGLVLAIFYLATALSVYSYAKKNEPCAADVAVVLGAAVFDNIPSPVFEERINHAANLYRENEIKKIIFTGRKAPEDTLSEADAAKGYALQLGVSTDDILLETDSWTTYTNLVNTKKIIEENGFGKVMIISDPLHLKRASLMARGLDMAACTSGTPTTRYRSPSRVIPFLLRESYFYLQHFVVKM